MTKKHEFQPAFSNQKVFVETAIRKHQEELFKLDCVNGISTGVIITKKKKEYCVELHLDSAEHSSKVPAFLKMRDEHDQVVRIRIRKIISGKAESHDATVGGRIANRHNLFNQGTIGYFVKSTSSGEVFLMSCYHVLRDGHDWNIFVPNGKEEIIDVASPAMEVIGDLCFGFRNNRFDIGLAKLKPGIQIQIPPELRMTQSIDVTQQDEYSETTVFIRGINSDELRQAIVYNDDVSKRITYSDNSSQVFEKLMSITRKSGMNLTSPTSKGDSGALVFNAKKEAMGIIVGGDEQFSYAMHMRDIEQTIEVEIVK